MELVKTVSNFEVYIINFFITQKRSSLFENHA